VQLNKTSQLCRHQSSA